MYIRDNHLVIGNPFSSNGGDYYNLMQGAKMNIPAANERYALALINENGGFPRDDEEVRRRVESAEGYHYYRPYHTVGKAYFDNGETQLAYEYWKKGDELGLFECYEDLHKHFDADGSLLTDGDFEGKVLDAAKGGDVDAQIRMYYYESAKGEAREGEEFSGKKWLSEAIRNSSREASYLFGMKKLEKGEEEDAKLYFENAAREDLGVAYQALGDMFIKNKAYVYAYKNYEKATEHFIGEAFYNLGIREERRGDKRTAGELFHKSATCGSADGFYKFAQCYEKSNYPYPGRDRGMAMICFEEAAALGNKNAAVCAGEYYERGAIPDQEFDTALRYYVDSPSALEGFFKENLNEIHLYTMFGFERAMFCMGEYNRLMLPLENKKMSRDAVLWYLRGARKGDFFCTKALVDYYATIDRDTVEERLRDEVGEIVGWSNKRFPYFF